MARSYKNKILLSLAFSSAFLSSDAMSAEADNCNRENIENLISTKTSKKMDSQREQEAQKKASQKSGDSTTMKMLKLLIPQTLR